MCNFFQTQYKLTVCGRALLIAYILIIPFLFSGCTSQNIMVDTVLSVPDDVEDTPFTDIVPTETPVIIKDEKIQTPERFLSDELLPSENSQIINPKKATYQRFNIDKEELLEFEHSIQDKLLLPVIHVSTKDNEYILSLSVYTSCIINLFNCPDEYLIDEASAGIRLRGNSSAYYGDEEKVKNNPVPYRIKFDKKRL